MRDFDKEYKDYIQSATPDYWNKIVSKLDVSEQEQNTNYEQESRKVIRMDNMKKNETTNTKRKSHWGRNLLIAACLVAIVGAIAIPTGWHMVGNLASTGRTTLDNYAIGNANGAADTYTNDPFVGSSNSLKTENAPSQYTAPQEAMVAEADVDEEFWEEEPMEGGMDMPMPDFRNPIDSERYQELTETGYSLVSVAPLSTFSADVDTASYANVRRMIEDGWGLDDIYAGSARPEEFVNYFSYDLNYPEGQDKFGITTYLGECPWNEKHQLLFVGLATEPLDLTEIPKQNITLLVDISGSMYEDLPLVLDSLSQLVDQFNDDDVISLVTYASGVQVHLDGVSGADKAQIKDVLSGLEAGGSTNGQGGIQKAYELATRNFIEGGNNRVILITDGDLNVGISEPDELEKFIKDKAKSGVYLSVIGTGYGNYRDDNLERIADCGNGNYSYVDSKMEAKKVFVEEFGANMVTVATDVKLQLEFNPENVNAYRLVGYEDRRLADTDFTDDTKDAGEIGAGHTVIALYEIIPADSDEAIELKYTENKDASGEKKYGDELCTLKIRYKEAVGQASKEVQHVITTEQNAGNNVDFRFASLATELAMIINDSPNKGSATLDGILKEYKSLGITDDEYKDEFYHLVYMLAKNQ